MSDVAFESVDYFTQEEFERWVQQRARWDINHYELLNRRIVMTPPAGYPHGRTGNRARYHVTRHALQRDLGEVFDSSQGFELPSGDTVEPDIAYISWERWRASPAPEENKFLRIVPDLVAEILSPSTASRDRGEKKAIYERNGVREYWLVDALAVRVTRFVLRDNRYDAGVQFERDDTLESEVLTGFRIPVRDLLGE